MAIDLVVFDCDGVLFDSQAANAAFYSDIALAMGRGPLNEEEKRLVHVATVYESLDHILRAMPERIPDAHEYRLKRGYEPFVELMIPEPGVYECLSRLKASGRRLAVLTNRATTTGLVFAHHRMTDFFERIVTAVDVSKPKPDPEGALKILAATGTPAQRAVYVGDAPSDLQTALAAGMHFIAYKSPALPCPRHVDHFDRLDEMIERL